MEERGREKGQELVGGATRFTTLWEVAGRSLNFEFTAMSMHYLIKPPFKCTK
jgi:hypothetical protein